MYISYKQYCKDKIFLFLDITDVEKYKNKSKTRIHPFKQKTIHNIIQSPIIDYCDEIILFGSSINPTCLSKSDIDLAIKLKNDTEENRNYVRKNLTLLTNGYIDILWNDDELSKDPIINIINKGVKIK